VGEGAWSGPLPYVSLRGDGGLIADHERVVQDLGRKGDLPTHRLLLVNRVSGTSGAKRLVEGLQRVAVERHDAVGILTEDQSAVDIDAALAKTSEDLGLVGNPELDPVEGAQRPVELAARLVELVRRDPLSGTLDIVRHTRVNDSLKVAVDRLGAVGDERPNALAQFSDRRDVARRNGRTVGRSRGRAGQEDRGPLIQNVADQFIDGLASLFAQNRSRLREDRIKGRGRNEVGEANGIAVLGDGHGDRSHRDILQRGRHAFSERSRRHGQAREAPELNRLASSTRDSLLLAELVVQKNRKRALQQHPVVERLHGYREPSAPRVRQCHMVPFRL